jgi:4-amino-4-deoxy-L-arabinose transferase-like glycosyltransferase
VDRIRKNLTSCQTILFVALLARFLDLFFFFHAQPPHVGGYLLGQETGSIAASIAAGQGFSSPFYLPSGPTAWVSPVFPYILGAVFKVFGTYTFHSSIAIRTLNVLFSALTCYPIILLGTKLFGDTVGTIAGWIWAFLPVAISLPVTWAWDMSLAALMLTIALYLTYTVDDRQDAAAWTLYGFVWGFTVLVNATVVSVFPGCLLFALYRSKQRGTGWLRLSSFAVLAFALTISPWIIRNQLVFHGKVLFRSNFGLELWLGNNPEVPDTWTWWLHPLDSPAEYREFTRLGEVAYTDGKKAAAIQFIKTHPADVARFQFHRFLETWTGHNDSFTDIWAMRNFTLRCELLMNYGLALFTFVGMLIAYRKMRLLSLPLLNVIVFFPGVYYLCHTTPRYRHPMDPVLALLSAYALVCATREIIEWAKNGLPRKAGALASANG